MDGKTIDLWWVIFHSFSPHNWGFFFFVRFILHLRFVPPHLQHCGFLTLLNAEVDLSQCGQTDTLSNLCMAFNWRQCYSQFTSDEIWFRRFHPAKRLLFWRSLQSAPRCCKSRLFSSCTLAAQERRSEIYCHANVRSLDPTCPTLTLPTRTAQLWVNDWQQKDKLRLILWHAQPASVSSLIPSF